MERTEMAAVCDRFFNGGMQYYGYFGFEIVALKLWL
jgi:hypothetical protein